jgi:hypothetical protein
MTEEVERLLIANLRVRLIRAAAIMASRCVGRSEGEIRAVMQAELGAAVSEAESDTLNDLRDVLNDREDGG